MSENAFKIFINKFIPAFRRDTKQRWEEKNPVLYSGELGFVKDVNDGDWVKMGDGVTPWNQLPYKRGPIGKTGAPGVYYGTEPPKDENHPLWVNPEGGGTVIDQSYSPTSPNPQSGKAIAEALQNIALNTFYPVGSIYMSVNLTTPSTLFGGTWEQIKDTFLLTAGDIYEAGTDGGEAEVTLDKPHMPAHSHHSMFDVNEKYIGFEGGTAEADRSIYFKDVNSIFADGGRSGTLKTDSQGGNQPHNNMPPYLVVYAWKRTA